MKKNLLLYIILLVFLIMCKKTPPTVIENNITDEKIEDKIEEKVYIDLSDDILSFEIKKSRPYIPHIPDTDDNKFIGYTDLAGIPKIHIAEIYLYEKYIVLKESLLSEVTGLWDDGFRVYEYNKDLKVTEYEKFGNRLYDSLNKVSSMFPYEYIGISGDFLFLDEVGDPSIRSVHIFDLINKEEILNATYSTYYRSFSVKNNIVSDLTMSDCGNYDDNIKTRFYELKEGTKIPESDNGLSMLFVVYYTFNVLTKEINLTRGSYIFVQ